MALPSPERPIPAPLVSPSGIDPLFKDLTEKKQIIRRNVVSLANELKEVRSRLALQEQNYVKETLTRQEVEAKAKNMADEISRLQESLEERSGKLQESKSTAEKFLIELDNLKSQITVSKAAADASAASAESAQLQYNALLQELDVKNNCLQQQEERIRRMEEQLCNLQRDLEAREFSQKQLKDEVVRVEHDIGLTIAMARANKECDLRKTQDNVSPKNLEELNGLLMQKDEEMTALRGEIKILSAHWRYKTKELESQLEKHRKMNQELKKRILKLEFCVQDAHSQTRKLQRMGERRDRAVQELRNQLATKQKPGDSERGRKQNFWESSSFKVLVSMSMLILVVFSKR